MEKSQEYECPILNEFTMRNLEKNSRDNKNLKEILSSSGLKSPGLKIQKEGDTIICNYHLENGTIGNTCEIGPTDCLYNKN